MRVLFPLLVLSAVAWATPVPKALKRATDAQLILGRWELVSVDTGDGPKPPDENKAGYGYEFREGGEYVFFADAIRKGDADGKSWYVLDPTADPKRLDLHFEKDGRELYSPELYELDGDTLTVCGPVQWGGKRPTEFKAVRGAVNVCVYARGK